MATALGLVAGIAAWLVFGLVPILLAVLCVVAWRKRRRFPYRGYLFMWGGLLLILVLTAGGFYFRPPVGMPLHKLVLAEGLLLVLASLSACALIFLWREGTRARGRAEAREPGSSRELAGAASAEELWRGDLRGWAGEGWTETHNVSVLGSGLEGGRVGINPYARVYWGWYADLYGPREGRVRVSRPTRGGGLVVDAEHFREFRRDPDGEGLIPARVRSNDVPLFSPEEEGV